MLLNQKVKIMYRYGRLMLLSTIFCVSCANPTLEQQQVLATTIPQGVDEDRDGVLDALDQCAQSVIGEPVDAEGCQPFHFKSLGKVYFEFDNFELDNDAKIKLDRVAEYLSFNRHVRQLIILGHTDEVGTVAYNDQLSDRRVASVQRYLLAKKIPNHQLRAAYAGSENGGLGERAPIDENWTRLGRARNRHVDLILLESVWQR
ncbi:MAG TPA: hypothetical protein DCZ03_09675 [Gammaproteobacteria bacterium]|nr:hypothetical protein [Gammaproteobacteria bacterium]